jgi:hypothetical protein
VAKERNLPLWQVARFVTVANSVCGLPAQHLTRPAISIAIHLLDAAELEEVPGFFKGRHLLAEPLGATLSRD